MDLSQHIAATLNVAADPDPRVIAFDHGSFVVSASFERTIMKDDSELEQYECEDSYDFYMAFSFDDPVSRVRAYRHALEAYEINSKRAHLISAHLSISLMAMDTY